MIKQRTITRDPRNLDTVLIQAGRRGLMWQWTVVFHNEVYTELVFGRARALRKAGAFALYLHSGWPGPKSASTP